MHAAKFRLYEVKIRKHKMLTEGIETQQRLMGQQLVNKITECKARVRL
jgi:hypothetical protein